MPRDFPHTYRRIRPPDVPVEYSRAHCPLTVEQQTEVDQRSRGTG